MGRKVLSSVVAVLAIALSGVVGLTAAGASAAQGADRGAHVMGHVEVTPAVHHDVSAPLRDMVGTHTISHAYPAKHGPLQHGSKVVHARDTSGTPSGAPRIPSPTVNFDGISANGSAPPDNNGAPGLTQYVELVNQKYAVYSKTGTLQFGPVNTNTLWSGFGGGCQTNNDGDGMILWDAIAQRWVADQFSVSTTPFLICVAVSKTTDATGAYNRYSFSYGTGVFPDYPKMGVWPDAYYVTFNRFNAAGTVATGTEICAFDRTQMLAGSAATQQCFVPFTSGTRTYLPANFDGTNLPPAGSPNYEVGLSSTANNLSYFKFHVDWVTPANSTLTGPTNLAVTAYSQACGGGACIPQSGTTQRLDSLADRVMTRLAYRNFGDHEALVVNHAITAGSSVGERWYELRVSGGNLSVFQQGTYAPDAAYRWMGSIAMDQSGDMALGYSVSSSTTHPGIAYTGRLPGDPAGQMPQGEATVFTGNGSQNGGLSRWGDYTQMSVDPADDCTFWYVNEYIPSNGSFNWRTRIAAFKFPSCGVADDFSIAANPNSLSVYAGDSTQSTISTTVTKGNPQTVTLSTSGLPSGASPSFDMNPIQSGQSSTLTIATTPATVPGTYTVTVTGTGSEATHSTTISLTVNPPDDFSMSADPNSLTLNAGDSGQSAISTTITHGGAQTVTLSTSGLPAGASGVFDMNPIQSGGSATLTINTSSSTPGGTYIVTVTGTGTEVTRTATISLTVNGNGTQLLGNPGFETGSAAPWVASRSSIINSAPAEPPHSGSWDAWLGGEGKKHKDTLYQAVTISAGSSSAALTFFLHIDTAEGSGVFDTMKVQIRNPSNTVLKTLATYSNLNAGAGYTQKSFDVTQFKGQTIRVFLLVKEDASAQTSFVVDDFALTAQGPAGSTRG